MTAPFLRVFGLAVVISAAVPAPTGQRVALPSGKAGIGFDDLRYSPALHRVLVPGGRTGALAFIDPDTLAVTTIGGFGTAAGYSGDHDAGPTSVDEGNGVLYVTDRTTGKVDVVDPAARRIIASARLASEPDYVRYVKATSELWVTEPSADQIEIFKLGRDPAAAPVHSAFIPVSNGPESMVVDSKRRRAYTHRWRKTTLAIDLDRRAIIGEWKNGCAGSRGIALDEERGFLFVSCAEGTASVLDVAHDGRILSTLAHGAGFDVIGYAPAIGHLYLAGSRCACLVTLGVSAAGALTFISQVAASDTTHCAVADDAGHAWWCDQKAGSVWRVTDGGPTAGTARP